MSRTLYENKQNFRRAFVISHDDKRKTSQLEDAETGRTFDLSDSTMKRWWKPILDGEEVKEVTEQVKQMPAKQVAEITDKALEDAKLVQMPGTEDPNWGKEHWVADDVAGDGTPLAEVGKEIAAQAAEKAKQAAKSKASKKSSKEKAPKLSVDDLLAKVEPVLKEAGYEIKHASGKLTRFMNIKGVGDLYIGSKKCSLSIRPSQVPEGYIPDRVRQCAFGAAFDISYDELDKLTTIINKMPKTTKKEEK